MKLINKNNLIVFFLLILFAIPSILPLFHKGFFVTDDGEWMIIRLSAFYQTFADGQFPVRSLQRLNFDYGYPVATFLYPGIMYIGSIIHLFKIGFVDSIKIILGLSMISSLVFSYFWLRRFFEHKSSMIGALFYTYAPYHLHDMYVRGSVGEILALAVVPFILWQIERKSLFFGAIGIALLMLSHNTLAFLFLIVIAIYMLLKILETKNKKNLLIKYLLIFVLGFGMSAFYWTPVLTELHLTVFSKTLVSDWNLYFSTINLVGYSTFFALLVMLFILVKKNLYRKINNITKLFIVLSVLTIFLAINLSAFVWKIIPVQFIQFPFRFLSVSILAVAYLTAMVADNLSKKYRYVFIACSIILLSFSAYGYLSKINYFDKGEDFYITNDASTTVQNEYMPIWVREVPVKRPVQKVEIQKGNAEIHELINTNKKTTFIAEIKYKDANIAINTIYWPGWKLFINNEPVKFSYDNPRGIIQFTQIAGTWPVELRFEETMSRKLADLTSIFSMFILILVSRYNLISKKLKI